MKSKIYKVVASESNSLNILTDRLNRALDEWKYWDTDLKFDANKESGNYYFVLTIFKD